MLARSVLVPFDSFIIVSVFRHMVNRKRPYEAFGMPPVLPKDKSGRSFPSRHTFSAFVIAMTVLLASPFTGYGIFLLLTAGVVGIIRIFAGIHYPSDVIAGAAVGVLVGIMGFEVF